MGFEPTTSALGRLHSATELRPQDTQRLALPPSNGNRTRWTRCLWLCGECLTEIPDALLAERPASSAALLLGAPICRTRRRHLVVVHDAGVPKAFPRGRMHDSRTG